MPQKNRLNLPSASAKVQVERRYLWNDGRCADGADFFTVGYSGRKTEELLEALAVNGIRTVLDIRQNPVSMYRPDLSKKNLKATLESRGMNYHHMPDLGVPREIRAKAIAAGTREVIWQWYDEYVVAPFLRSLHRFLNSAEHPVAMLCVEIDPSECHRHRLFVRLEQHGLRGYDL